MKVFAGKTCVVTGGGSGIGQAICVGLAQAKAVVVVVDFDPAAAQRTKALVEKEGVPCYIYELNVTDAAAVKAMIEGVAERLKKIDYLFNIAGMAPVGEIRDTEIADWRRVMDVNFFGVLHGTHTAYRVMLRQGHGHIVNMSSGLGHVPGPFMACYSSSKFAVLAMSEALRIEAAPLGIKVTTLCPAWVQTPAMTAESKTSERYNHDGLTLLKAIPFKFLTPSEAARCCLEGVARNKGVVIFPFYMRVVALIYTLWPRLAFMLFSKNSSDFRKGRINDVLYDTRS